MKTISMPLKSFKKWVKALRSGKYEQGASSLCKDGKYCCLGVLQDVLEGKTERGHVLPSKAFLKRNAITFLTNTGREDHDPHMPSVVMPDVAGCYNKLYNKLSYINDSGRFNFKQIADLLEENFQKV